MDKNFRIRLGFVYLAFLLLAVGILIRPGHLMLSPPERLRVAAKRQFPTPPPEQIRRGPIFDRNGEPLAVSLEVRSLYANPNKIQNPAALAQKLSPILQIPAQELTKRLGQKKSFIWLRRHITEAQTNSVEEILDKDRHLNSVLGLAKESKRFYPNQSLAAQIVGFTDLDSQGVEGMELVHQKTLMASSGETKSREGRPLRLTINKSLQYTLEAELESGVKNAKAQAGTAIVMDADTGQILAMASYPTFNPNSPQLSPAANRRNRGVTDMYEPGSTIKPILVAGALEAGYLNPSSKVYCEMGKYKIGKHWVSEAESKDKWGWLTIAEVLKKSSNIGTPKIGDHFTPEKLFQFYKSVGLTEKTGSRLPGEVAGRMAPPKKWSKIAKANISFGQGLAITPIQLASVYSAIANGGTSVRPTILLDEQSQSSKEAQKNEDEALKPQQTFQKQTTEKLIQMMSGVAESDGTAPKAAIPGFVIVGKTGTAQKAYPGVGYRSGKYIASFIGFARNTKLKHVILVVVDEPEFPFYGGEAAAPIFKKIMMANLALHGISPDPLLLDRTLGQTKEKPSQKVLSNAQNRGHEQRDFVKGNFSSVAKEGAMIVPSSDQWMIPDFRGATAREAMEYLGGKDIQVRVIGSGVVTEQYPSPQSAIGPGGELTLKLTREPQ